MTYTVSDRSHVTITEEQTRFPRIRMTTTVLWKVLGFGVGKGRKKLIL